MSKQNILYSFPMLEKQIKLEMLASISKRTLMSNHTHTKVICKKLDGMTFPKFQCTLPSIEIRWEWELTRYNFYTQLPYLKGYTQAFIH